MIVAFGDSHSRCFEHYVDVVHYFTACSAKGLNNPNSTLNVGRKIKNITANNYTASATIFLFGKVDLDFVMNYKFNDDKNFCPKEFIQESVDSYTRFLKKLPIKNQLYVCEPTIPHLNDHNMLKAIQHDSNLRNINNNLDKFNVNPKRDRTKVIQYNDRLNLCLRYGELLRLKCDEYGFNFIGVNKMFKTDSGEYTIPRSMRTGNRKDHHLNSGVDGIGSLYIKNINI